MKKDPLNNIKVRGPVAVRQGLDFAKLNSSKSFREPNI